MPLPPPAVVARPRLMERLHAGLHGKLTLLSAPAGFGKTTLVSTCLQNAHCPVSWLSLDEQDNDLVRFLTYVMAALQRIDAKIGQNLQTILQAPQLSTIEPLMTSLINDLAALDGSFVLVLDDYHLITLSAIHDAVTFLLKYQPPQMHLILISRREPPLRLSRLRVGREVTEIGALDLRFTRAETSVFFKQTMGLHLTTEAIRVLETRTEGWIAGLQLAALSIERLCAADRDQFITTFAGDHRYVLDYLMEEVLLLQPAHLQAFLLQTSILNRLNGPLCDALLGDGKSGSAQKMLQQLERNNLFLIALDNQRGWYRYHHLFRDLLRHQLLSSPSALQKLGQQVDVRTLHRRASAWYQQNGLLEEAIGHSLAAQEFDQVAHLIEQTVDELSSRGEFTTLLGWLAALPDDVIRTRPDISVRYAWMLMITHQIEAAERCVRDAERAAEGQFASHIQLQIRAVRAHLARSRHEVANAIDLSQQVLSELSQLPSDTHQTLRLGMVHNLAYAYLMAGEVLKAKERFLQVLTLSQQANNHSSSLGALAGLAQVQIWQGKLQQAANIYRRALEFGQKMAQKSGQPSPLAALAHFGLGELLREWNKLDESATHLAQAIELAEQWQLGAIGREAYIAQARLKQAQSDLPAALASLQQAEQLELASFEPIIKRQGDPIAACRAQLMLAERSSPASQVAEQQEALHSVLQWAQARGLRADDPVDFADESEYLVLTRLLIVQNKPLQALPLLARLLSAAETNERTGRVIEIVILQALAHHALGESKQAQLTLKRALSLAEPHGYVRLFVDEGISMLNLLRKAATAGLTGDYLDYINKLLAAFDLHAPRKQALIDPLTERERQTLRHLATKLTIAEIASQMVVAPSTIRTYNKRIYSKLNVHSRAEAVYRAQELGLL